MTRLRTAARGTMLVLATFIGIGLPTYPVAAANDDAASTADSGTAEAQERFRRGVALYGEGDFSAALVELNRAFELAPNFKILFNLGQVAQQLRDYAAAMDYLTRYLEDGGERIPAARRLQVEADLVELRLRVGSLGISITESGLAVVVDDVDKGSTPLAAPLLVNVGRHRVELVAPTGDRYARIVDVAGGQTVWPTFTLKSRPTRPGPRSKTAALAAAPVERTTVRPTLAPRAPEPTTTGSLILHAPQTKDNPEPRRRWTPWVAWALTAACAGGAAISGSMALTAASELQSKIDSYPVSQRELESLRQREREFALATDGLIIGTVALAALSLYLTMSKPSPVEATARLQRNRVTF